MHLKGKQMRFAVLVALGAIAITAVGVFAETVMDGSGVATGTSNNVVTPLGEKHVLVKSQTTYESFAMTDPAHPYNGMTGECFGSFEMKIPSAAGSGSCVFTDDTGDVSATQFVVTGMTDDGAVTGTWAIIGGTGKFSGASGGGAFSSRTDQKTGKFQNTVSGAMILK